MRYKILLLLIGMFCISCVSAYWLNETGSFVNKGYLEKDMNAYWNFNVNGNDSTGEGSDCFGDGSDHQTSGGAFEGFYNFSEVNNNMTCISVSDNLRPTKNITLSMWVNFAAVEDGQWLYHLPTNGSVSSTYRYGMFRHSSSIAGSNLYLGAGNGISNSTSCVDQFTLGKWTMLTWTYNGTTHCMYQNATLQKCIESSGDLYYYHSPNATIGVRFDGQERHLGGIDEIGLWNRSLNSTEIQDLWNGGNPISFTSSIFLENSQTYNTTSYETKSETFSINITYDSSQFTSTSATLYYNNIAYNGTKSGSGNIITYLRKIDIDNVQAKSNLTFNWEIGLYNGTWNYYNSTFNNQSIDKIILGLCNSTLNIPYINFTFKNETTSQETVNASIISTWTYYLGDGTVNKTLSFSNSSINPSYDFCFIPSDRRIIAILDMSYNNPRSQQRIYTPTLSLSNVTTNQVLYLLPTILGIFNPFNVIDVNGDALSTVRAVITRVLGGSTITIASDYTDDSGFLSLFLNPDVTYTAIFTKVGFTANTFSFVPTTNTRTVTMGASTGVIGNGTIIISNTSWITTPTNSSLPNNTDITFGLNVSSSQTITLISLNITNSSGTVLGFASNAGTGFISIINNTGNNTRIIGKYVVQTGTETFSFSRVWIIGEEYEGDYSLFRQLNFFIGYGFSDFIRLIIVLLTIVIVVIFMSSNEVVESSESKVIVIMLMIWGFSLVGWLDTGLASETTGTNLDNITSLSSQYGIAILSTVVAVFFVFRRVFIRRI